MNVPAAGTTDSPVLPAEQDPAMQSPRHGFAAATGPGLRTGSYLGLIRSEGQRASAPAVVALAQDRGPTRQSSGLRRLLGIALRCYQSASRMRAMPAGAVALPGGGHKHDEVRAEFRAVHCGAPVPFASPPRRPARIDPGALRVLLRVLPLMWRTHSSRRLRPYCEVLTLSRAFTEILARDPIRRHWLIIGDLSTYLIALAGAARQAGHGVVYWQYSYLDFKHMPVRADAAVILNDTGRALAAPRGACPPGAIFWRPRQPVAPLRITAQGEWRTGAVLNAHADTRALMRLVEFHRALARPIEVRLHPNSRLHAANWPEGLKKAPDDEPLEVFARRHDLVLGGNSQAQLKVLLEGTMVVHCAGLDPLPFDHHSYVRDGILPGWYDSTKVDQKALQSFFEAARHLDAFAGHIGPDPDQRVPGLSGLLVLLGGGDGAADNQTEPRHNG